MSFASEVKNELTHINSSFKQNKSELNAILHINGDIALSSNGMRLEFTTTNPAIARRVIFLVKELYSSDVELVTKKRMKLNKNYIYIVRIITNVKKIISEHGLLTDKILICDSRDEKIAFSRGAFLASGSVNDPKVSNYHLEFSVSDEDMAIVIRDILNSFNLNSKYIQRRSNFSVYIKQSEKIGDCLRMMGSLQKGFDFEDQRIFRDMINTQNRTYNCDIANATKALTAAMSQVEMINYIEDNYPISSIPERLQNAIKLRKKFPEDSLQTLSENSLEIVGKTISKSGLNHCFRDIKKIYQKLTDD